MFKNIFLSFFLDFFYLLVVQHLRCTVSYEKTVKASFCVKRQQYFTLLFGYVNCISVRWTWIPDTASDMFSGFCFVLFSKSLLCVYSFYLDMIWLLNFYGAIYSWTTTIHWVYSSFNSCIYIFSFIFSNNLCFMNSYRGLSLGHHKTLNVA